MKQEPKFAGRWGGKIVPGKVINPVVTGPTPREPTVIKAKFTPHQGTARRVQQYTGDQIVGIGTMHKSNAVPVFSNEEAEDLAKMRRN